MAWWVQIQHGCTGRGLAENVDTGQTKALLFVSLTNIKQPVKMWDVWHSILSTFSHTWPVICRFWILVYCIYPSPRKIVSELGRIKVDCCSPSNDWLSAASLRRFCAIAFSSLIVLFIDFVAACEFLGSFERIETYGLLDALHMPCLTIQLLSLSSGWLCHLTLSFDGWSSKGHNESI